MTRRSSCTGGARLRARVTAAVAGIAAGLLITPAALAAPKSKRVVDGAEGQRVAARHGGGAFKPEVATNRSSTGLTDTKSATGTRSLDLQGRYQHVHYAIPDGSGGYTVGCTDDLATLRAATGGGN
ncbi:MAG TPA: hypothetical protein VGK85_13590 [Myxococcaceae bacterium]